QYQSLFWEIARDSLAGSGARVPDCRTGLWSRTGTGGERCCEHSDEIGDERHTWFFLLLRPKRRIGRPQSADESRVRRTAAESVWTNARGPGDPRPVLFVRQLRRPAASRISILLFGSAEQSAGNQCREAGDRAAARSAVR